MFTRSLSSLALLLFVTSCGTPVPLNTSADRAEVGPEDSEVTKPMLPAHALPGERFSAGKADQYSDFKHNNSWAYGITSAPKTPMRAVAQWDSHQTMLLSWTGSFPETYAGILDGARGKIDIHVVHDGSASKQQFKSRMAEYGASTSGLTYIDLALDSIWIRDFGPLSVRTASGAVSFVDPRYYHGRVYDDAVPTQIATRWGINAYRQPLNWEGGTYIADGLGNCFYTTGVYQHSGLSQSTIHKVQRDYLGCETNIVTYPLQDEGTTHSDMFSKMVAPGHMLIGRYDSWQDSGNAQVLNTNAQIVQSAVLNDGSSPKVTRIPMPNNSGRQVWRTYANSLFVNGVNLVPVYSDETSKQAEAMAVWKSVMPGWDHVAVDSTGLIQWSGAVHCITMTVPSGSLTRAEAEPQSLCGGDYACNPSNTYAGSCELGFAGCCDGGNLRRCTATGVESVSCGGQGCGWSTATRAYACGGNGAGPASAPMTCGASSSNSTNTTPRPSNPATTPPAATDGCAGVTYAGCCAGGSLKYCQSGQLKSVACGGCGWASSGNNGSGWYDCGGHGADPSGENPLECPSGDTPAPTTTPAPTSTAPGCGDETFGGRCEGSTLVWCEAETVKSYDCTTMGDFECSAAADDPSSFDCHAKNNACVPACDGKTCGMDGCGGVCGLCPGGQVCVGGACQVSDACGGLSYEGCCAGSVLRWCENHELKQLNCQSSGCGWNTGAGFYDCKHSGAGPAEFPLMCGG